MRAVDAAAHSLALHYAVVHVLGFLSPVWKLEGLFGSQVWFVWNVGKENVGIGRKKNIGIEKKCSVKQRIGLYRKNNKVGA